MHIEDIKRWHWMLIAVVVGLLLSYALSDVPWGDDLPTLGQIDFERGVAAKFPQPGHIANVVVLPSSQKDVTPVVFEQLRRTSDPKKMEFHPSMFRAPVPFKSQRDGQTYASVNDFLSKVPEKANPDFSFKYAWHRDRSSTYILWTTAAVLLIGVVWPSLVSLLTGGGLGFVRAKSSDPEYDLSRFGNRTTAQKSQPGVPSAVDLDEVRRLDDELERRLAAGATSEGGHAQAPSQTADEAVRALNGGPLETANLQDKDESKEYGGEFYPVVKAIHKK
jgi:hypothetical protein